MTKHTNSSFRTRAEREIVRTIYKQDGLNGLKSALIAAGESEEAATEYLDDFNAIPTSLLRILVKNYARVAY